MPQPPVRRVDLFSRVGSLLSTSFEQGVHIRVVQEILGHTWVTTTERYTHVATLQMKDGSERMDEALWGQV
jgi:site-specific recombinase XerC